MQILIVAGYTGLPELAEGVLTLKITPIPQTYTVKSSDEALAILEANEINLILTTGTIERESGWEFLKRVKTRFPTLPAILMVHSTIPPIEEMARHGVHLLRVPFVLNDLLSLVATLTGAKATYIT